MNSALEWARWWQAAGFAVTPVAFGTKRPTREGWPKLRLALDELPTAFPDPSNIGIVLGTPSGGAVDVDLDSDVARQLAPYVLPPTGLVYGRPGNPRSHWMYRVEHVLPTTAYKLAGRCLLELRASDAMNVVPGSVHPSGEPYTLDSHGAPATVPCDELNISVRLLAVAATARDIGLNAEDGELVVAAAGALLRTAGLPGTLVSQYVGRARLALGAPGASADPEALAATGAIQRLLGSAAAAVLRWLEPSIVPEERARRSTPPDAAGPVSCILDALRAAGCVVEPSGRGFSAQCPAHMDDRPSLSISSGADGRAMLMCHAGCDTADVIAALGLQMSDLFISGPSARPRIRVGSMSIPDLADRAWAGLAAINVPPTLFVREGRLVELREDVLEPLTHDALRNRLARAADWRRRNGRPQYPPSELVADMLSDRAPKLPVLRRVLRTPTILPNGEVLVAPGYDEQAGTLMLHGLSMPAVPAAPSPDDVQRAVAWVLHPLQDFPFVSEADRANAVALMLVPLCRELIQGPVPLHGVLKPTAGTGGSLLAKVLLYPALGREAEVAQLEASESEVRKTLTAKLRNDPPAILFDNVRGHVASTALASAITTTSWEDRELSASRMLLAEVRAAIVLTGNNLEFSREHLRRLVPIRLDAEMENPQDRSGFRIPLLLPHMAEHRAAYVWACLTLAKAWIAAGKPLPSEPRVVMGMFESYCNVIGGILAHAGIWGFLKNRDVVGADVDQDERLEQAIIEAWRGAFPDGRVGTVAAFFPTAQAIELLDLGPGNPQSCRVRLGQILRRMRGKRYGIDRFEDAGKVTNAMQYRLVRVASLPTAPSAPDSQPQPTQSQGIEAGAGVS